MVLEAQVHPGTPRMPSLYGVISFQHKRLPSLYDLSGSYTSFCNLSLLLFTVKKATQINFFTPLSLTS
jgi:hypothetical protein